MVRFARAEGSKGSNKRVLEDATPWSEMVAQLNFTPRRMETTIAATGSEGGQDNEGNSKKKRKTKGTCVAEGVNTTGDDEEHSEPVAEVKEIGKKLKKKKNKEELTCPPKVEFAVDAEGERVKVFKDGTKRTWFDLPYEENERITRYDNMWVKQEMVGKLNQLKESLKEQNLEEKEVMKTMMKAKRKAHRELRMELIYEQKNLVNEELGEAGNEDEKNQYQAKPKKDKKKKRDSDKTTLEKSTVFEVQNSGHNYSNNHVYENITKVESKSPAEKKIFASGKNGSPFIFEENEVMTQYDGFWIKRDAVDHLNFIKAKKMRTILEARGDGSTEQEPTEEKVCMFRRAMKKEKRRVHQQLIEYLKTQGIYVRRCNEKRQGIYKKTHNEDRIVKYDGSLLKIETVKMLEKLKEELLWKGVSEEEVKTIIKRERRREERTLRLNNDKMCFQCRQAGHIFSECPQGGKAVICYLCGSTEHKASDCNSKNKGKFVHATCFGCGESGHIIRQCPNNPRGLYPDGGACRECGSVEHFAKNCPTKMKEKEEAAVRAQRIDFTQVDALDCE